MLSSRGARADRLPRVRSRPARHAAGRRRPGAQGVDRAARAGARCDLPEPRQPTATATPPPTCGGGSPARSADAPRRSSVYGDVTTGAESDLEQITAIARQMVGRWGMSAAVGPVTVLPRDDAAPWRRCRRLGVAVRRDAPAGRHRGTAHHRGMLRQARFRRCSSENRGRLDRLAHTLLKKETLDEGEAYAAAGVDHQLAAVRRDAA